MAYRTRTVEACIAALSAATVLSRAVTWSEGIALVTGSRSAAE
jgi:hypothetical protein